MTIQIPHSWLKDFVKTKATPKKIAQVLSTYSASVEKLEKIKKDWLYHIEITTNRIDMVSVIGMAREVVACLKREGINATFTAPKLKSVENNTHSHLPLEIVNDPKLCYRVTAVIMEDIEMKPSPDFIQHRLTSAGVRCLNNIVDITNYVMLEIGHPTHVFDYDLIKTHKLIIRTAKKGEKIITLDGKEYYLAGGDSVIDDGTGQIIDLPGIMGAKNSVVNSQTKRILFFIENNDPKQIRRTMKSLGIRTLAGTINEKGVDPNLAKQALERGIELFEQFAQAKIASPIFDIYPQPPKIKEIKLDKELVSMYLGVSISQREIKEILSSLGFQVKDQSNKNKIIVTPPSWRSRDIQIAQDVIEEIARMYGYHKIPSIIPPLKKIVPSPKSDRFFWQEKIKDFLLYQGFHETYTYSLISEDLAEMIAIDKKIRVANPLSKDQLILRPSLVPSLLSVISQNQQREEFLNIFELANVYTPAKKQLSLPLQKPELCLLMLGADLIEIKKICQLLFEYLNIYHYNFTNGIGTDNPLQNLLLEARCGEIRIKNDKIAIIGEISPAVRDKFAIRKNVVLANFSVSTLIKQAKKYRTYHPLPKFPPIIEDLTFSFPPRTPVGPIIAHIQKQSALIKRVELVDEFQTNKTFRLTFQHLGKTLTSKEVEKVRKRIIKIIEKKFSAKLKGVR